MITDSSTGEVEEVSVEPIPVEIKPIILETTVTEEGTTIINTNTVDQVLQYNENFMSILEEMKMAVPMIMTEQILGIRVEVSEDVDAQPVDTRKQAIIIGDKIFLEFILVLFVTHFNLSQDKNWCACSYWEDQKPLILSFLFERLAKVTFR